MNRDPLAARFDRWGRDTRSRRVCLDRGPDAFIGHVRIFGSHGRVIAPRPPGVSRGGRTGHRQGTARRDVVAGLDVGGDRHAKSLGETMGEPVRAKRPHMAPSPRPVAVADWGRSQAAPGLPPVILRFGPDPFGERQEQHARLAIGTAPVPRQCRASAVRRRSKTLRRGLHDGSTRPSGPAGPRTWTRKSSSGIWRARRAHWHRRTRMEIAGGSGARLQADSRRRGISWISGTA